MGRLTGSWDPPAWGGPWMGLLLAASVLSSCLQPAPAQTILITPQSPVVGGDVSLALQNPPQDFVSCNWYRAATPEETRRILTYYPSTPLIPIKGPAHTERETVGPVCALTISRLMLNDTGSYTLQMDRPPNRILASVNLRISASAAEAPGTSLSAGAIAGIVIGSLAGAALVGGLVYFLLRKPGGGPEQRTPVRGPAAPAHNQGVGDDKPPLGKEDIQYSTLAFTSGAQKPPPGPQPLPAGGTVYSEIRKK